MYTRTTYVQWNFMSHCQHFGWESIGHKNQPFIQLAKKVYRYLFKFEVQLLHFVVFAILVCRLAISCNIKSSTNYYFLKVKVTWLKIIVLNKILIFFGGQTESLNPKFNRSRLFKAKINFYIGRDTWSLAVLFALFYRNYLEILCGRWYSWLPVVVFAKFLS